MAEDALAREMHAGAWWLDGLATVDELVAEGLNRRTVRRRIHNGRWSEPLPGIVSRFTGDLSPGQQLTCASLYGGPGATLSCATAAAFYGFGRRGWPVHLVVPHGRHLRSTDRVVVHQTTRDMRPRLVDDLLVAPPARAAVDMALEATTLDNARALLGRALQKARLDPLDLADELDLAPRRGSRFPREAMADMTAGARSASEARLVRLLARSDLPTPVYNGAVETRIGTRFIDALWLALGKGVEIDGAVVHLDAAAWGDDLVRQNAIQLAGVVLLRIAARRLWTDSDGVLAEIRAFLTDSALTLHDREGKGHAYCDVSPHDHG